MKCFLFGYVYNKYQIRSHDNYFFDIRFICSKCNHSILYTDVTHNLKEYNQFNNLIERYLIEKTIKELYVSTK